MEIELSYKNVFAQLYVFPVEDIAVGSYGYLLEFQDGSFVRGYCKTIRACVNKAKKEMRDLLNNV